jgi:hypothetical protein
MPEILNGKDPNVERQATAMFTSLVSMFYESAMFQMGKMADPATGKTARNLEGAQSMIGMIEMLEIKTDGNRSKEEEALLKNALGSLHLTFVEEIEALGLAGGQANEAHHSHLNEKGEEVPCNHNHAPEPAKEVKSTAQSSEEPTKRFSKKYN